jgi:hypothetical protein
MQEAMTHNPLSGMAAAPSTDNDLSIKEADDT